MGSKKKSSGGGMAALPPPPPPAPPPPVRMEQARANINARIAADDKFAEQVVGKKKPENIRSRSPGGDTAQVETALKALTARG